MIYFDRVEVVNILDPTHGRRDPYNILILHFYSCGVRGLERKVYEVAPG